MSNQAWSDQRAANRLEDLRWMISTGECLAGAAERLDVAPDALVRWCERRGLSTELALLRAALASNATPGRGGRPERPAPCGTERAYQRHYYRGEPVDDACAEAHRVHNRVQSRRSA